MNFVSTVWALLPPVIAIVFALKTKEVYLSLLLGIVTGTLLLTNFHIVESMNLLFDTVVNCLSKPSNIGILMFLVMLGMIVTLMTKSGGSQAYGKWAKKKMKSSKQSLFSTFVLGVVIFVDDYAPVFGFFKLGRKTKLIQVWHAGEGFKSVGYSRFGKDGSPFPDGSCHKQYTHVITGSEHLIDVFHEVFGIEKEAFYPVGMPRMDGFLDPEVINEFKDDFYTKYPELQEKKIILFAPTYRGAEQKYAYYDYSKLDFQRIYEFCQKEDAVFLIKMHPFVKTLPEIPEFLQDRIREFSRFPDINKLYYVTDLLITDYSSNYFEYALLQRPVVFYTYDREFYELTRGVHRSILESAPGKVCDTFDQLMECLEQKDFETEKIIQFAKDNFGGYRGDASDRVIDEILLQEE